MITYQAVKDVFKEPDVVAIWSEENEVIIGLTELGKRIAALPFVIQGVPTRVRGIGEIFALELENGKERTDKWRPAPGGVSIGHPKITAGTFGVVVEIGGDLYILSNNHVLANSNNARVGDYIMQPGPLDQGGGNGGNGGNGNGSDCPIARGYAGAGNLVARALRRKSRLRAIVPKQEDYFIARLTGWIPIEFEEDNGGESLAAKNKVDAALAKPLSPDLVRFDILELGIPTQFGDAQIGDGIAKSGRTTGVTTGEIAGIDAVVRVNYGSGKLAIMEDQIIVNSQMLQGGDSGSLALLRPDYDTAIGLGFAGSNRTAIFNKISNVREALNFGWPGG